MSKVIESDMYFLENDPMYGEEKPYSMRFYPGDVCPQSNIKRSKQRVVFNDMRTQESKMQLDECGFEVLPMRSHMEYEDFGDRIKIENVYLKELAEAIKQRLGATYVHVIEHTVRRRDVAFPISTGRDYEFDQPTALAHVDFTLEEAKRIVRNVYGKNAHELLSDRWQLINAWRPLRGPLYDWPLALCDARTVDYEQDTMPGDIVFTNWTTENLQVMHSSAQKWYWLPGQLPEEVLIFKSAESLKSSAPGIPHSGFYNPDVSSEEAPRESIESRILVFYGDPQYIPAPSGDYTGVVTAER
ncbi:hypothetical protein D6D13_05583 [Aureobasidium pullulans]|uniref:Methyltransferase n=1 Tax=Aureobasidium pullulans TaxID=5580 RepID=A0A4S9CRH9_AURPU|nr:hypothetical protein D6D13_05583 [Aureobasidium pullulans]